MVFCFGFTGTTVYACVIGRNNGWQRPSTCRIPGISLIYLVTNYWKMLLTPKLGTLNLLGYKYITKCEV